jgi:hypothetical protein
LRKSTPLLPDSNGSSGRKGGGIPKRWRRPFTPNKLTHYAKLLLVRPDLPIRFPQFSLLAAILPAAFALLLFAVASRGAAQLKQARVSQVIRVKLLPNKAAPRPASVSDEVRDGTAVSTGVELRAELTFTDATLVRLGANTIFSFNEGTRNLELGGRCHAPARAEGCGR